MILIRALKAFSPSNFKIGNVRFGLLNEKEKTRNEKANEYERWPKRDISSKEITKNVW